MKHVRNLFAALMMVFAAHALAQSEGGAEYTPLEPAQPTHTGKKIEVLEFFYYGCPHCFAMHPKLTAWEEKMPQDVQLDFVPVAFGDNQLPMAYAFYSLKTMRDLNKISAAQFKQLHEKLYEALNVQRLNLNDMDKIADFVAQQGVDRSEFVKNYTSYFVRTKVEQSRQMTVRYQISGTPTVVVEGKYMISPLQPDDTIRVLNQLIDKVRKERGKH